MFLIATGKLTQKSKGFLRSVGHEIAPGIYTSFTSSKRSYELVWDVLQKWFRGREGEWIVAIRPNRMAIGGAEFKSLGNPSRQIVEIDGVPIIRINN